MLGAGRRDQLVDQGGHRDPEGRLRRVLDDRPAGEQRPVDRRLVLGQVVHDLQAGEAQQ